MVRPAGIEPATSAFGGRRSNPLSYGRMPRSLARTPRTLANFLTKGQRVVASFERDELNEEFSLWISAGQVPYSGASYGATSRALRNAPKELKPGVRFEKKAGSRKCLIDGREFDLY